MPVSYQVRFYDTSGALVAVLDRFRSLSIEHRVNTFSTLTLSVYSGEPALALLTLDSLIEVRRRYPEAGLDWYTEYIGFHRTSQHQITSGDLRIFTSYSRGLLDLINRRTVRWHADTEGSDKGPAPTDDVVKQFVRENAGSLATVANGRVTDGVTPGLAVAADTSASPHIYEGAHAWKNLLQTCQDVGEPFNVYFDVVWLGGVSFEFRTYYPRLGTDRSVGSASPFVFAPEMSNMSDPSHTRSRTEEVSSVLVLGPGEGPLRDTTHVTGPNDTDSPWNFIEQNHNAPAEDREQAILDIADEVLYEKRAITNVAFEPIQTPHSAYRVHYFLGDVVTVQVEGFTDDVMIHAVSLSISGESNERIALELEEYEAPA